MTRAPLAAHAVLDLRKVTDYLLSDSHPEGRHKAAFFKLFGFSPDEPACLGEALRSHVMDREIAKELRTDFGTRYVVECSIGSPDGRNPCIVSVWQERAGGLLTFITAYPK